MTRSYLYPVLRLLGPIGLTLLIIWVAFTTLQPLQFLSEEGSQASETEAITKEDESSETTSQVEESPSEQPVATPPQSSAFSEERITEGEGDELGVSLLITTTSGSNEIAYNGEPITYGIVITLPEAHSVNELELRMNLPQRIFKLPPEQEKYCLNYCDEFAEETHDEFFPDPLGGSIDVTVTDAFTWRIPIDNWLEEGKTIEFKALLVGQSNNSSFVNTLHYDFDGLPPGSTENGAQVRVRIDDSGTPTLSSVATWFSEDPGGTLSQDWADFDLDGDLDLALGSSVGAAVYEFNEETQRLENIWNNYGLSNNQRVTYGVRWGDFAGDENYLELVTVGASDDTTVNSASTNRIYKFTPEGSPPFTILDTFSSNTEFVRVETGDLDGDKRLDLIVATNSINANCPVRFYANKASSGNDLFSDSFTCLSDQASAHISAVDKNNNGKLDLMLGLFESQSVGFLSGPIITDTTTTITDRRAIELADPILFLPYDFAWGDYDSDGYLDLAAGYPLEREIRVYRNLAGSGFGKPIEIRTSLFRTPLALDWGDFDGDGKLDLVVNDSPPKIYSYNSGTNEFDEVKSLVIDPESIEDGQFWAIDGIDQDGDGDLDLAMTNRDGPSSIFTLFAPRLQSKITPVGTNRGANQVAWGDANRDGWLDLVFGASAGGTLSRLYINQQDKFSTNSEDFDAGFGPHSLAFGNMSGKKPNSDPTTQEQSFLLKDYTLELAIGTSAGAQVYESNNPGALDWEVEGNSSTALAWGDVNDDRVLDLLVGNANGPLQIYLNNKEGNLSLSPNWTSNETDKVINIAWGDYDNDKDLDFAVANEDNPARLYRNDGVENVYENNAFVQKLSFTLVWNSPHANTTDVAWADIDQDGDLDLTVAYYDRENAIYKNLTVNEGSNSPSLQTEPPFWEITGAISPTTSLAWADFDNDGDIDLAVGNQGEADQLYVNEGSTSKGVILEWLWQSQETYETTDLAWGDRDRDGDLDLAVSTGGNNESNGFYLNTYVLPSHLTDQFTPFTDTMPLPNNASYVSIERAKVIKNGVEYVTDDAYLYSSPEILSGPMVTTTVAIPYKLYDPDGSRTGIGSNALGDEIVNTFFEYSLDGNKWKPATAASTSEPLTQTSRLGEEGIFLWNALADGAVSDHARFRVRIVPANHGQAQQASTSAISPPFRVRGQSCVWLRGAMISSPTLFPDDSTAFAGRYRIQGSVIEGSGVSTYNWRFTEIHTGDDFTATGANILRDIENGTYMIELEVKGAANSCLAQRSVKASRELTVGTGVPLTDLFLPLIASNTATTNTHSFNETAKNLLASNATLPMQVSILQGGTKANNTSLRWQAIRSNDSAEQVIDGYRIYRAALGTTNFDLLAEVPANETEYVDQATCGYLYYVTAFNETGESAASKTSYSLLACQ